MTAMHVCVHNCSKYIYKIAEVLFVKQCGVAQVAIVDHTILHIHIHKMNHHLLSW